jgi:hypothetical protein
MLYYLPLEMLDQRYTILMDQQIVKELDRRGAEYLRIYGSTLTDTIDVGAFLDSDGTNFFKASQIKQIAVLFRQGRIKDGDKFFVSDLWFPGIEAIPYMAMFHGVNVEIHGILHAGSWTDSDFVNALKGWARDVERGWVKMATRVYTGSRFHVDDMVAKGVVDPADVDTKVMVTGIPFDAADVRRGREGRKKRDLVVFPCRLDDEKQPWVFDEVRDIVTAQPGFEHVEFVKTQEQGLSKDAYFDLLAEAKVAFTAALQENYGQAVLEAAAVGAVPVVPNRVAYTEMWPSACRYSSVNEAVQAVIALLGSSIDVSEVPEYYSKSTERIFDEVLR